MVNMCVEINTTRSIAAQILRHRSFSFQEFSQRYAKVTADPTMPELRLQDYTNRQSSLVDTEGKLTNYFSAAIENIFANSQAVYEEMIAAGVAKECAREVLPLATPTRLYMNGTIRSWIHYCQLRCGNGTQLEHRMIAERAYKLLQENLPSVCEALTV
jgi:thymidylate synthase (FAD)